MTIRSLITVRTPCRRLCGHAPARTDRPYIYIEDTLTHTHTYRYTHTHTSVYRYTGVCSRRRCDRLGSGERTAEDAGRAKGNGAAEMKSVLNPVTE